jgi:hypothetical protein
MDYKNEDVDEEQKDSQDLEKVEKAEQEIVDIANELKEKIADIQATEAELNEKAGDKWKDELTGFTNACVFQSKAEHIAESYKWIKELLDPRYLAARAVLGAVAGGLIVIAGQGIGYELHGVFGGLDAFAHYVNDPSPTFLEMAKTKASEIAYGVGALISVAPMIKDAVLERIKISGFKKQKETTWREHENRS